MPDIVMSPVPARNAKDEAPIVLPNVTVCTAAPVAIFVDLDWGEVPMSILPEPAFNVRLEELSEFPMVTEVGDPSAPTSENIDFPKKVLY